MSVSWEESVEVLGATYREGSGLCLQAFLHGAHQALTEKTGLSPEKESLHSAALGKGKTATAQGHETPLGLLLHLPSGTEALISRRKDETLFPLEHWQNSGTETEKHHQKPATLTKGQQFRKRKLRLNCQQMYSTRNVKEALPAGGM